jgi:hypothetical protein
VMVSDRMLVETLKHQVAFPLFVPFGIKKVL